MKKLLILKMGETLDSIKGEFGDFDDHILSKCNLCKEELIIVDCKSEEEPPNINQIKGIIITGSHSMVTNYEPWSIKISRWLENIIETKIPVLGICYGHQLLADILGGKVGYNENGVELGTVEINLTQEGKKDKLLRVLPTTFKGHEAHSQIVTQIPLGAKILAYNDFTKVQSFIYGNHIWGVQFHPEFVSNITKEYINFDKEKIINSGRNFENIYDSVEEHKYGEMILNRFIEIINK